MLFHINTNSGSSQSSRLTYCMIAGPLQNLLFCLFTLQHCSHIDNLCGNLDCFTVDSARHYTFQNVSETLRVSTHVVSFYCTGMFR